MPAKNPRLAEFFLRQRQLGSFKIFVLLSILGFICYAQVISYPFVHDDVVFIQNNPYISHWDDLPVIFLRNLAGRQEGWEGSRDILNAYYRPVLDVLYKIQFRLWGLDPRGYHLFNIILHVLNSFLVYGVCRKLIKLGEKDDRGLVSPGVFTVNQMALAVAILFLIHPLQTEAVTCIAGVSNLLVAFFMLISFIFYSQKRYILSFIVFAVSLLTKEQAVMLPGLFFLYEYCFRLKEREEMRGEGLKVSSKVPSSIVGRVREGGISSGLIDSKISSPSLVPPTRGGEFILSDNLSSPIIPFVLTALAYLGWRRIVFGSDLATVFAYPQELWLRILALPRTLLMYLKLYFLPFDLHYYRSIDVLEFYPLKTMFFFVLVSGMMAAIYCLMRQQARLLGLSAGWFFIAILPMANVVPLINEYSLILTAEHFLYLPTVGVSLFVVVLLKGLWERGNREFLAKFCYGGYGLAALLIMMTIKQNVYWRGEVPLFERVVQFEKRFGRAHLLLAKAYHARREFDKAALEYGIAGDIMQGYLKNAQNAPARLFYAHFLRDIYFDLAHAYEDTSRFPEALSAYAKAIALFPSDDVLYNNRGVIYLRLQKIEEAAINFTQAAALNPHNLMAKTNLAFCFVEEGRFNDAQKILEDVLRIDSQFLPARQNLERLQKERP